MAEQSAIDRVVRDEQAGLVRSEPRAQVQQHRPRTVLDVAERLRSWARGDMTVGVGPPRSEQLGMRRFQLITVDDNIKMGTAIFRYYLGREKNNVGRALARYNGSLGRRTYPDLVINRWTRWNGADDLGRIGNEPRFTW